MKTVHLIFNAHLDPIWLWPWPAGLDEALATCRNACDRLDAHPDLYFSRGEAWVYQQVERCDPALFERICHHVQRGHWEIVGGWWLQPDCNLPSGWALEKQIALGQEFFLDRFGCCPRIGYNVDSFGHAATLPGYMNAAGQDCYVMMRPGPHEMALPARLFRWRGYEDGPEVTTFRIASAYTTTHITLEHIGQALTDLPAGIEDTMCFVGVGDHGGGPTERQIAWCRAHENAVEGWRLVFSTPSRFFAASAAWRDQLPVVTGELQQHAIGCYSVHRPIKTALRRAEHLLAQAQVMTALPDGDVIAPQALQVAWERVCFHHFHDTLGGTLLPTASRQVEDQLGQASASADEALHLGLRRKMRALPDDVLQRVVAFNASDRPFDGYLEVEPWLGFEGSSIQWQGTERLLDEAGQPVALQAMCPEAADAFGNAPRLLLNASIPAGEWHWWRLECQHGIPLESRVEAAVSGIRTAQGVAWTPQGLDFGGAKLPLPRLDLIEDYSDTWSHSLDRYSDAALASAQWGDPLIVDQGPLMASVTQEGRIGESRLHAEWRVYAAEPFVELRLRVHWIEKYKLLKLTVPLPDQLAGASERTDGILGACLRRPNDGRELPLRDWTLVESGQAKLGIVCPDVYAVDATAQRLRLTLLRSAVMAHHTGTPDWIKLATGPRQIVSDQGVHEFRFRFVLGPTATAAWLDAQAMMMQRPPLTADLTRGMPPLL